MGNSAARDTEDYRQGYPGKEDDPNKTRNVQFYKNLLASRPNGGLIDDIHRDWFGNYSLLESHHGFIQWLFPIREQGMNGDAQVLQLHEAKTISADPQCRKRAIRSCESLCFCERCSFQLNVPSIDVLMLDFYGMSLKNHDTGEIERSKNWKRRYSNLCNSSHNWLRVTRILKSLGEFG
jgi:hypothetical protein